MREWTHDLRRVRAPAPGQRSGRDPGVAGVAGRGRRHPREEPRPLPALGPARPGPAAPGELPGHRLHAVRQQHPARGGAVVPGRRARGAAHPGLPAVERGGDGHPGQQARRRDRRPPVHVRQLGRALRGRAEPLLPREGRRPARRPHLLPGPRRARRLRPGLPRGPAERGRSRPLPHRDRPRRPELLPAPPADAGVLGVPDRLDGPRARSRPSTTPASTGTSTTAGWTTPARPASGASWATASATSPRRSAR